MWAAAADANMLPLPSNGELPVTLARSARLMALGVLMSLLVAAGIGAMLFGLLLSPVLAATATAGVAIFRLPRWAFRALSAHAGDAAPAPAAFARAWWVQPQG